MVIQQAFTLSTTENTKVNKVKKKKKDSRMLAFRVNPDDEMVKMSVSYKLYVQLANN